MVKTIAERLEDARTLADIFELVKEAVRRTERISRAGLTLGLAELGGSEGYFVGAFYPLGSNVIVMNKMPLRRIFENNPELYKPYVFHILLHEYLHAFGNIDEEFVRKKAYEICRAVFGEKHLATEIAQDIRKFLPDLTYPPTDWQPKEQFHLEMVPDFDRSNTEYIM